MLSLPLLRFVLFTHACELILANFDCISRTSSYSDVGGGETITIGCTSTYPILVSCGMQTRVANSTKYIGVYHSNTISSNGAIGECIAEDATSLQGGSGISAIARCCQFPSGTKTFNELSAGDTVIIQSVNGGYLTDNGQLISSTSYLTDNTQIWQVVDNLIPGYIGFVNIATGKHIKNDGTTCYTGPITGNGEAGSWKQTTTATFQSNNNNKCCCVQAGGDISVALTTCSAICTQYIFHPTTYGISTTCSGYYNLSLYAQGNDKRKVVKCTDIGLETLTGCALIADGDLYIDGCFAGIYDFPHDNVQHINIAGSGDCIGVSGHDNTNVYPTLTCCNSPMYPLQCVRRYGTGSTPLSTVSCDTEYQLVGCSGYSIYRNINAYWIDDSTDICYARSSGTNLVYATAICCKLQTYSPTTDPTPSPTNNPTPSPTNNPTPSPTIFPTPAPTNNPTNNPIPSPTSFPTPAPTYYPTPAPTNIPTSDPTIIPTKYPSNYPTNYPTNDPSFIPSKDPTSTPTNNPTIPTKTPTQRPTLINIKVETIAPTNNEMVGESTNTLDETENTLDSNNNNIGKNSEESSLTGLNIYTQYTSLYIGGLLTFIIIFAYIYGKYMKPNDFFRVIALITASFHILDMVSDILFAISVLNKYLIIFYLSIAFIIIPLFLSLYQLHNSITSKWVKSSDEAKGWIKDNVSILYIFSVITGSSFTAIDLCYSHLFNLTQFQIPLSKIEIDLFKTQRIYSIILTENLPQIALQCWYITLSPAANSIVYISLTFSSISILITVISLLTQKAIINSTGYVELIFDVIFDVNTNINQCKNIVKKPQREIVAILGVNKNVSEILRPTQTQNGLTIKMRLYISISKAIDMNCQRLIQNAKTNGRLAKIFQNAWSLSSIPGIENIECKQVNSKQRTSNTINIDSSSNNHDGEYMDEAVQIAMIELINNGNNNNNKSLHVMADVNAIAKIPQVVNYPPSIDKIKSGSYDSDSSFSSNHITAGGTKTEGV